MKYFILGLVIGSIFTISIIVLLSIYFLKSNKEKNRIRLIGSQAEEEISKKIKRWSKLNLAYFIPGSLYCYDKNKVFEVDGIIVTTGGVIVCEMKSISGNIYGSAQDETLLKEIKSKSFEIKNPILQNDKHIEHVMKIIPEKLPMISLIIFSDRIWDINITEIPQHTLVSRESELLKNLDKIKVVLQPIMKENDAKRIFKIIRSYRSSNFKSVRMHKIITGQGMGVENAK